MDIKRLYTSNNQRSQLIKRNVILGFGVRGVSILASLILVPLTINYISSELYGIWLTLSSIIHWIGFFDIGFGNGLRNKLAESVALNDYKQGRVIVSTTYAVLFAIFITIGLISFYLAEIINWSSFLKVSQNYNTILIKASQILLAAFCLQMILKLIQNVIQAFQWNALASLLDALGNILSLILVYVLTLTMAPNLQWIAIAFSASPLIVLCGASVFLYMRKFQRVSPHYKYVSLKTAKEVFQLGGFFFIIQIASVVLYQMINILISRMCGPEQVTNYNVSYKYLSILLMVVTIIVSPMWSAFTDAFTKQDYAWMKSIHRKMVKMCGFSVICMFCMVLLSPYVYKYWIGETVYVSLSTTIFVGIYVLILIWGMVHSFLLNGMSKIYVQLCYSVVTMVLFLPFASFLGEAYNINGILSAMIIINIPSSFLCYYQVMKLLNRSASGIWDK